MVNNKKLNGWIPRNLNEIQELDIGFGITLRLSDLPFILGGGLICYTSSNYISDNNILKKIILYATIMSCSYLISKIEIVNDQTINETIINAVMYYKRKLNNKQ